MTHSMTNVIELARYQSIDHEMTFEGVSLTGATFHVRECFPPEIEQAQFTILSAAAPAKARMFLPAAQSAELKEGGKNFFRLEVRFPGGGNLVMPKIGINVS